MEFKQPLACIAQSDTYFCFSSLHFLCTAVPLGSFPPNFPYDYPACKTIRFAYCRKCYSTLGKKFGSATSLGYIPRERNALFNSRRSERKGSKERDKERGTGQDLAGGRIREDDVGPRHNTVSLLRQTGLERRADDRSGRGFSCSRQRAAAGSGVSRPTRSRPAFTAGSPPDDNKLWIILIVTPRTRSRPASLSGPG